MEECDARILRRRRAAAAAEDLSGVRSAGWNQHDALPRVRREPAIFTRGTEQKIFRTLRRAGSARDLRAAGHKYFNVRRELDVDHASGRGRRPAHALGHERRSVLSIGGEPSVPVLATGKSVVAAGYGDVPARRIDSHRLQHDDPDAIWSVVGRTIWVRALPVSIRSHGGAWLHGQRVG